jgi:histidine triad (HIT) family protein
MLREVFEPDGLFVQQNNGTAAFQTVPHVHWHVIPTRDGFVWPPTAQVPITPSDQRVRQADRLRPIWERHAASET